MIGVEIALFTTVVIVWGLPFALKVRQAVAVQMHSTDEETAYLEHASEPRSVEMVELVYVPVVLFFFTQDMTGAMIMTMLGFMIHAGYMIKLSPSQSIRLAYTPQVQRLTGTVYLIGGLITMAAIILAAFWTIGAGLALMIMTIWSVYPLVRTVQKGLSPVEEHVRNTAIQDAVRLISVSDGMELILSEGIQDPDGFETVLREKGADAGLFQVEGNRLSVYEIARQMNSGPVSEGEWIPVYAERIRETERDLLVSELKPDWLVRLDGDSLLIQSADRGQWQTVLETKLEGEEPSRFAADQLLRIMASG